MKATDQGTREPGGQRYTVIPRTLVFVTSRNPHTGDRDVLLLRGAPDKRLWPNLYNGLGGHVEQGEGVSAAAEREVQEEAGLTVDNLDLRGVISIDTGEDEMGARPGVMVFVFHAESRKRVIIATDEGTPEWIAVGR